MSQADDPSIREKIEKLPKWARDYISGLRTHLQGALESVEQVRQTKTQWGHGEFGIKHGMPQGFIPDNEAVRWYLDDHDRQWVDVRRMRRPRRLLIYGSHGLVCAMSSSNMMTLSVDLSGEWTTRD